LLNHTNTKTKTNLQPLEFRVVRGDLIEELARVMELL
jgi:uncharacterized protein (DUF1499 family)